MSSVLMGMTDVTLSAIENGVDNMGEYSVWTGNVIERTQKESERFRENALDTSAQESNTGILQTIGNALGMGKFVVQFLLDLTGIRGLVLGSGLVDSITNPITRALSLVMGLYQMVMMVFMCLLVYQVIINKKQD